MLPTQSKTRRILDRILLVICALIALPIIFFGLLAGKALFALALLFTVMINNKIKVPPSTGLKTMVKVLLVLFWIVVLFILFFMTGECGLSLSARCKGIDAAVKANLANGRALAELYRDSHGNSYAEVCQSEDGLASTLKRAAGLISKKGDHITSGSFSYNIKGEEGFAVCHDSNEAYAAIVSLKNPQATGVGWCIDSKGASKEATHLEEGGMVCP